MSQSDGGAAFARPWSTSHDGMMKEWWREAQTGMTLRDYVATHAMQGLCAGANPRQNELKDRAKTLAKMSWQIADAMLEARGVT